MNTFVTALLSIGLSVAAQFSLKAGISGPALQAVMGQPFTARTALVVLTDKFVLGGFVLYGLGALVWLGVLSRWDVSKAYPLVGLGFAVTVAIDLFAGEQVTLLRAVGVALICAGVYMVGRS